MGVLNTSDIDTIRKPIKELWSCYCSTYPGNAVEQAYNMLISREVPIEDHYLPAHMYEELEWELAQYDFTCLRIGSSVPFYPKLAVLDKSGNRIGYIHIKPLRI